MKQMLTVSTKLRLNGLKRRKLNGKSYLTGPVVMAREIVMNGLLYKGEELAKSVPFWNGRIVTNSHPKDKEGVFISANSDPETYEQWGQGLLFATHFTKKDKKLKSEVWLDEEKLKENKAVQEAIDEGRVLEVSTGLFVDVIEEEGVFEGRKYRGIATNLRPDHLALLPDETGACSVEDGAGFPRANTLQNSFLIVNGEKVTANATDNDIRSALYVALRAWDKQNAVRLYPMLEDLYGNQCVFSAYDQAVSDTYRLFRLQYNVDGIKVTFSGEPVRVLRNTTYEDEIVSKANPETNNKKGTQQMNRKAQVDALIANGKFAEDKREHLMGLDDAAFDAASKETPAPKANTETPKAEVPKVEAPKAETSKVLSNVEKDRQAHANRLYDNARSDLVAKIKGNARNQFTDEELSDMTLNQLEKLASLAITPDFAGKGGAGGAPSVAANTGKMPKPYVRDEEVLAAK